MTDTTNPPERYTSYHSDRTYSILDKAREYVKQKIVLSFEYSGLGYSMTDEGGDRIRLYRNGPKSKFLMPDSDTEETPKGELPTGSLATFHLTDFTPFISRYEIEGKTLEWILEHQREWKYLCPASHLEAILNEQCFSFAFVYRKVPCYIGEWGGAPTGIDREYNISIHFGEPYDVTRYAPVTPGAYHWTHDFLRVINNSEEFIKLGSYATMGDLLDRIRFGEKTLREIFDTEYDDGEVLCGCFGV